MRDRSRTLWPLVPDRLEQKGFLVLALCFLVWFGSSVGNSHYGGASTDSVSRCESLPRINEAPPGRIEEVPGIGITLAKRIVTFRRERGPLQSFNDLRAVSGIGPKTIQKIERYTRRRPCESD